MHNYSEQFGFKSIFYFCPLPIRFDSYSGCSVGCLYCWSQWCGHKRRYLSHGIRPIDTKALEKRLEFALGSNDHRKSTINQLLEHRCPVHFGGLSEPLQALDKRYRATYKSIEIFRKFDYPILLSTNGSLLGEPEYLDLLASHRKCAIQVSFSTLDDNLAKKLEPGAYPPTHRIQMIRKASKKGLWVAVRIQPFLFPFHKVEDYNLSLLAEAGAKHIIVEHLRIPTNFSKKALAKLFQVLGMDVLKYYRERGIQFSRVNYELKAEVKVPNIIKFRNYAHKVGMTFGCGDNDLHHFSDDDCCCGVGKLPGFENIYKGTFLTAVLSHNSSGEISFNTVMKAWHPNGSIREYLNSDCRTTSCSKPLEYLAYKWNAPGSSNSPSSFYGVEYRRDSSGLSYRLTERCLREMRNIEGRV